MTGENMVTAYRELHSSTNFDPENKTGISLMKEINHEVLEVDAILA